MSQRKIKKKKPKKEPRICTEEEFERLSHDPNFIAQVREVQRAFGCDEAGTTITITLPEGMYERIQSHLIETMAECESVETYIQDALEEVLEQFLEDPFGGSYES